MRKSLPILALLVAFAAAAFFTQPLEAAIPDAHPVVHADEGALLVQDAAEFDIANINDYLASPVGIVVIVTFLTQLFKKLIGTQGWATKIVAFLNAIGVGYLTSYFDVGFFADAALFSVMVDSAFIGLAAMGLADLNQTKWIQDLIKEKVQHR